MAAPRILKYQDACLKKLVDKEKSVAKVFKKNILCPELQECTLKNVPNIFKYLKQTSETDQDRKKNIRSQLEIGVSAVFRALEKDRLACVVVSGQAKPAAIVDHVISLARERGCPLLCLDSLSTTLAAVTKTKVFPLCIGFKNTSDEKSDFKEIVSLILENTNVKPLLIPNKVMSVECTKLEELPAQLLSESLRPVSVETERELEIMEELKSIISKSLAHIKTPETDTGGKKRKKKPRRQHKNLKDIFIKSLHCHFEVGKRTVLEILERGKLQLILVSSSIMPYLMTETPTSSLLKRANQLGCPIICVPGLTAALKAACGANLSVLGFKKFSSLPPGTTPVFQSVIEKCRQILQDAKKSPVPDTRTAKQEGETFSSSATASSNETNTAMETGGEENKKRKDGLDKREKNEDEEEEEEDYSYLHILKKDSTQYQESMVQVRKEIEESNKDINLSANFISLGSGSVESSTVTDKTHSKLGKRKKNVESDYAHEQDAKKHHGDKITVSDEEKNVSQDRKSERGDDKKERYTDIEVDDSGVRQKPAPAENSGFISFSDETQDTGSKDEQSTTKHSSGMDQVESSGNMIAAGEASEDSHGSSSANKNEAVSITSQSKDTEMGSTPSSFTIKGSEIGSTSSLFTISRKGDAMEKEHNQQSDSGKGRQKKSTITSGSTKTGVRIDAILGSDTTSAEKKSAAEVEAEHIRNVFSASATQGKKKGKRKAENDDDFISLVYTEANIQTMVSNVNKKRKKKKKR